MNGVGKQPLHCNSQMEVPQLKRLNWGVMISLGPAPKRRLCYVGSPQGKRSKNSREFAIIYCREQEIEKHQSAFKYNESL